MDGFSSCPVASDISLAAPEHANLKTIAKYVHCVKEHVRGPVELLDNEIKSPDKVPTSKKKGRSKKAT